MPDTSTLDPERWEQRSRWWWSVRAAYGEWGQVPLEMLPAFWAHPSDTQWRPYADWMDPTPASCLGEALAIQEVYRKQCSRDAEPVWFTVPRVLPSRGELLGSVHAESKRCGKDGCGCASGEKENLHGPYYYRRWRDEDGTQHKERVADEDLGSVRASIEKRRTRVQTVQALRKTYVADARAKEQRQGRWGLVGHVERWTRAHESAIRKVCPGADLQ